MSCGAAVRAGARFCPQCGKLMEAEAPAEVARADEGDAPAGAPPAADVAPAAADEIRLEESWRSWEESVGARTDAAAKVEAPAREQPREEVSGESRGGVGETPVPLTRPLQRPQSTLPAPSVVQREGHDDGRGDEGAAASASAGVGGPLARPRAGEKGSRAAAVKESLRPRVERVRDASMGVLEDAAEDSGLRFVLIAIVLFAVFLVFLFINNLVR
ncbi:MAG TPA: zinc ribbon domain-containing protein [Pyrinomonadaceae bacterium]